MKIKNILIIVMLALSAIPVSPGVIITDVNAILIDELSDYEVIAPIERIKDPYIYQNQILTRGYMPLIITVASSDEIIINNINQIERFLTSYTGDNYGITKDIEYEYLILKNTTYNKKIPRIESVYDSVNDTYNDMFIGNFDTVSDWRYEWQTLKEIELLEIKPFKPIVVCISVFTSATLEHWGVDVIPRVEVVGYIKDFDQYAWWDANWNFYRKITIAAPFITNSTQDFPICVYIADVTGDKCDDGDSIRFVSTNNVTTFDYEIERWTDNIDRVVFVNITEVMVASTDYDFLMYYNNSGAADAQNPTGVWNKTKYMAVYHMNDAAGNIQDSTNQKDGVDVRGDPTYEQTGKIGYAMAFDGTGDAAAIPDTFGFNTMNDLTLEFWINPSGWAAGVDIIITPKGETKGAYGKWAVAEIDLYLQWRIVATNYLTFFVENSNPPVPLGEWRYLSAQMDEGTRVRNFVNASVTDTNNNYGADRVAQVYQNYIGSGCNNLNNPELEFFGLIDEVRISNVIHNRTWLELSYDSMNNTAGFLTFGAEIAPGGAPGTPTVPISPTNFLAVAFNTTQINLTWTKGINATHTRIQSKINGYPVNIADGTNVYNGTGSSYNNMSAAPGQIYYYGAWSWRLTNKTWNTTGAFDNALTYPLPPNSLAATKTDGDTIQLNWVKGTGANNSRAQHSIIAYPANIAAGNNVYNTTGIAYTHNGVGAGNTHYYRIWSFVTWAGLWHFSPDYTQDSILLTPDVPTGLTVNGFNDTWINVSWVKGTGALNTILRYGSTCPTTSTGTLAYNNTGTWVNITGLTPNVNHCIRAWSWVNNTYNTTYDQVTQYTRPSTPTNLFIQTIDSTTQTAIWTKGAGGSITHVRLKTVNYPARDRSDGQLQYNSTLTTTTRNILAPGDLIQWRAWAFSPASGYYSFWFDQAQNLTQPLPPSNVLVWYLSGTIFNVTWAKGTGADDTIIRRLNGTSYPTLLTGHLVGNNSGTWVNDPGIQNNTQYMYRGWSFASEGGFWQYSDPINVTWGFTTYYVFNESDGVAINPWDIFISNNAGTQTYNQTGASNGLQINTSDMPVGNPVSIEIDATDFNKRWHYAYLINLNNRWYNLSSFLPWDNDTQLYYIMVINEYDAYEDDVHTTFSRYISSMGSYKEIASHYTDGAGTVSLYLIPSMQYKITFNKTGYLVRTDDYTPDPNNYGIYYPKYFKIYTAQPDTENFTEFTDHVTFNGYVNRTSNTVYFNYTDDTTLTTNTKINIYSYNFTSRAWGLLATDSQIGNNNYQISQAGVNTSHILRGKLWVNHSVFGARKSQFIIYPPGVNRSLVTATGFNLLFTANYGTNPFGWSNTISFFIIIACLISFDERTAGVGILFAGGLTLFFNIVIGFNPAGVLLPSIYIILGGLVIWQTRRKEGVST